MVNVLTLDSGKLVQQSDPQDYMQMVSGRWVETNTSSGANAVQLATGKYVGVTGPASCASGTIDGLARSWTMNSCNTACSPCQNNYGLVEWNVSTGITNTAYSMQVWLATGAGPFTYPGDYSLVATVNPLGDSAMSGCSPDSSAYDGSYKHQVNVGYCSGTGTGIDFRFHLRVICDATSGEIDASTSSSGTATGTQTICS